jgi:hypothetical protein
LILKRRDVRVVEGARWEARLDWRRSVKRKEDGQSKETS